MEQYEKEAYAAMTPQEKMLYDHMVKHGSITQAEAYEQYGITRTASRIHAMRTRGIGIVKSMRSGKNRFGVDVRYAVYRLGGRA
jgi:hypothetical protein